MKFKKLTIVVFVILMLTTILGMGVYACTSVVVGKDASVDGSVMTTHTCDGWYDARIQVVPGQTFHVGYPFMNENQVMIGETTISGRRDYRNGDAWMVIEQLQVLGLQRAKTARECVEIMGALAEKYGYGDGGECLTVTDPNEAWFFEILGPGPLWTPDSGKPGAVWVAQRIPDDEVGVSANRSRIGEIDLGDTDHFIASSNVFSLGEEMGFYDPNSGKPFIFWEVYGPKTDFYNRRREWPL